MDIKQQNNNTHLHFHIFYTPSALAYLLYCIFICTSFIVFFFCTSLIHYVCIGIPFYTILAVFCTPFALANLNILSAVTPLYAGCFCTSLTFFALRKTKTPWFGFMYIFVCSICNGLYLCWHIFTLVSIGTSFTLLGTSYTLHTVLYGISFTLHFLHHI